LRERSEPTPPEINDESPTPAGVAARHSLQAGTRSGVQIKTKPVPVVSLHASRSAKPPANGRHPSGMQAAKILLNLSLI
jgi:hypothetical protein